MRDQPDRRVLVIANEFPPVSNAGVQRPLYFCRYLPEFGWSPVVLTVKDVLHFAYDRTLLDVLPDSVKIVRTESLELRRVLWHVRRFLGRIKRQGTVGKVSPTSGTEQTVSAQTRDFGRALRRWMFVPDDRILWLPFAVAAAVKLCRTGNIHVLYSTVPSYSVGTIGLTISRITGIPLVLDLRDPWTGDPYHQGPTPLHRTLSRRMEASALRHARKVVVICEDMKRFFLKKYPDLPESKLAVITNGYDGEEMAAAVPIREEGRFTVVYSGALYAHHAEVFEAFCRAWSAACESSPDFSRQARFLAVGRADPEVTNVAHRYPRLEATFLGYQPHRAALQYLTGGDLLLLLIKNIRTGTDSVVTIPGKLFEYIGSQRPILMIGPAGDASKIIGESGRGSVCEESDVSGIAARLLGHFAAAGGTAPEPKPDVYDRRGLTGALARCLAEASQATGSSAFRARGAEL